MYIPNLVNTDTLQRGIRDHIQRILAVAYLGDVNQLHLAGSPVDVEDGEFGYDLANLQCELRELGISYNVGCEHYSPRACQWE